MVKVQLLCSIDTLGPRLKGQYLLTHYTIISLCTMYSIALYYAVCNSLYNVQYVNLFIL